MNNIYNELESLEKKSITHPRTEMLNEVSVIKRKLFAFRRVLNHERDMMIQLSRREIKHIRTDTLIFMRDIYDDLLHVIDTEEALSDMISSIIEIYMSSVNNSTNQIIKVLTVVSSFVLIPT